MVSQSTGNPYAQEVQYSSYNNLSGYSFISKTTLEGVITGKNIPTGITFTQVEIEEED